MNYVEVQAGDARLSCLAATQTVWSLAGYLLSSCAQSLFVAVIQQLLKPLLKMSWELCRNPCSVKAYVRVPTKSIF